MKHWAAQFIGKPFADHGRGPDAFDCWGLVRAALKAGAGVDVPSYTEAYVSADERAELHALIAGSTAPWQVIAAGREREFDLALFRIGRWVSHFGLIVRPGFMLHVSHERQDSCIESYRSGRWAPKLEGFYRHAGLAGLAQKG